MKLASLGVLSNEFDNTQVDNLESPKIVSVPRSHQALPTHVIIFHKNAN